MSTHNQMKVVSQHRALSQNTNDLWTALADSSQVLTRPHKSEPTLSSWKKVLSDRKASHTNSYEKSLHNLGLSLPGQHVMAIVLRQGPAHALEQRCSFTNTTRTLKLGACLLSAGRGTARFQGLVHHLLPMCECGMVCTEDKFSWRF